MEPGGEPRRLWAGRLRPRVGWRCARRCLDNLRARRFGVFNEDAAVRLSRKVAKVFGYDMIRGRSRLRRSIPSLRARQ